MVSTGSPLSRGQTIAFLREADFHQGPRDHSFVQPHRTTAQSPPNIATYMELQSLQYSWLFIYNSSSLTKPALPFPSRYSPLRQRMNDESGMPQEKDRGRRGSDKNGPLGHRHIQTKMS